MTLCAGGRDGGAKKITTFPFDGRGVAEAAGSYKITKADERGVAFQLVGAKSGSEAKAGVNAIEKNGHKGQKGQGQ